MFYKVKLLKLWDKVNDTQYKIFIELTKFFNFSIHSAHFIFQDH